MRESVTRHRVRVVPVFVQPVQGLMVDERACLLALMMMILYNKENRALFLLCCVGVFVHVTRLSFSHKDKDTTYNLQLTSHKSQGDSGTSKTTIYRYM